MSRVRLSDHILPAWLGARRVLSGCVGAGGGGGGGIMTAESISTRRDGVRSKRRLHTDVMAANFWG